MNFRRIAGIALIAVGLTAGPVQAGQCGYDYCWGALSLGDFGAAGRSSAVRTAPDAAARALKQCGARCDGYEVFVNSCAAFAEDSTQVRSFGWADDRAGAETRALETCQATGKGCKIRVWACSQ